jgi:hypothetical protein
MRDSHALQYKLNLCSLLCIGPIMKRRDGFEFAGQDRRWVRQIIIKA